MFRELALRWRGENQMEGDRLTREDADVTVDLSGVSQCKFRETGRGTWDISRLLTCRLKD